MIKFFSSYVIVILLDLFICRGARGATFTFTNKCDYTVWPGILAGAGSPPLETTGFSLPRGTSRSFQAPASWSGRFWARTGCSFDESGQGSCATGDCRSGSVECNGAGATPPATLAEFTLGSGGSKDFYDVSLVDGYNLPMIVEGIGGTGVCATTGCNKDLNRNCPAELRAGDGGACRSACEAFGTPEYCCSGEFASPDTCKPSFYSQVFKNACPKSYSYAFDDATSTFTCMGADYTMTFCPESPIVKSSDGPWQRAPDNPTDGSGSGSGEGAMLENGSWLAGLATGDSSRIIPYPGGKCISLVISIILSTNFFLRF